MDLFEHAELAKKEGMAQADRNAAPDWKSVMDALVVKVARSRPFFTTDDVFEMFDALPNQPFTHEGRAMGPVMLRAAKHGVCKKSDRPWTKTRRKSRHAAPLQVWESLIFIRV